MSRDDEPASVEERLGSLLDLPALLEGFREGADAGACLEASHLRTCHDALTPPLARALLRTGVWKPDDLRGFLAGSSAPGAAALIASECCDLLERDRLPEILQLIETEADPEFAAHATRHLVAHCLRSEAFELAEGAVAALTAREDMRAHRSATVWLGTALAVHEHLHGHGDAGRRMREAADGQARELFDEWCTGNQEPWRTTRALGNEEEWRREALLTVLSDTGDAAPGTRPSTLQRLGERRARRRALDAVLEHARATSDPGMLFRAAGSMRPGRRQRALVGEAIALRERIASEGSEDRSIAALIPVPATTHDPIIAWLTEVGLHPAPAEQEGDAMHRLAPMHDAIGAHLLRQVESASTTGEVRARNLCRIAPFLHAPEQLDAAIGLAVGLESPRAWARGYVRSGAPGIGGAKGLISALAPRLTRSALLRAVDLCCLEPPPAQRSWKDLLDALEHASELPAETVAPLTRLARRAPEGLDFPKVLLRLPPSASVQAAAQLQSEHQDLLLLGAAGDASPDGWTTRQHHDLLRICRKRSHARTLLELRLRPPRSENALFAVLEGMNPRLLPKTKLAPALAPLLEDMTDQAQLRLLERVRRLPLWLRRELLPTLLERTLAAEGEVFTGALRQLRASLTDLCGEQPVQLGHHTSAQLTGLDSDLPRLSNPQLHRLLDRLAPDTEARHLRALSATLLEAAASDPESLDLVAVAARLPGFADDARAAPLLESWIAVQEESSPELAQLPQAAWDCLDLDAVERLERVFRQRTSDAGLQPPIVLFANGCRRCWVERSPHAALDRIERALDEDAPPKPPIAALDALAELVDERHLGRYLELYRRLYEASAPKPAITGFAGIMRRGLALGRSIEEVLSWTAFALEDQRMEPAGPLLDDLDAGGLAALWRWQLDRTRPRAEDVRALAPTAGRLDAEEAASLWQIASGRAPELDEETCLALVCAFLPQLPREQESSALTLLLHDFEQRVVGAARAATAAARHR